MTQREAIGKKPGTDQQRTNVDTGQVPDEEDGQQSGCQQLPGKDQEPHAAPDRPFDKDKPAVGLDQPVWPAHRGSKPPRWQATKGVDNPALSTAGLGMESGLKVRGMGWSGEEKLEKSGHHSIVSNTGEMKQESEAVASVFVEKQPEPLIGDWSAVEGQKSGQGMSSPVSLKGVGQPESQHTELSIEGGDLHSQQGRHWLAAVSQEQTEQSDLSLETTSVPAHNKTTCIPGQRDRLTEASGTNLMRDREERGVTESDPPAGLLSCFRGLGSFVRRKRVH